MQYYRKNSMRSSLGGGDRQGRGPGDGRRDDRQLERRPQGRPEDGGNSGAQKNKRKRKFKIKKRFFVFLGALVVLLALLVVGVRALVSTLFAGYSVVDYGMMEAGSSVSALLLRDEIVVRADGYGTVEYIAQDFEQVTQGDHIVNFFSSGYTQDIASSLARENERIDQQQKASLYPALEQLVDTQLGSLQSAVDDVATSIRQAVQGDYSALLTLEDELSARMDERQTYLESTNTATQSVTLSQMYDSKRQLLARIEDWKSAYNAPMSGRVSYSFDGLEAYLTTSNLSLLDISIVKEIMQNNDPQMADELRSQQPLYRVVNPNKWYAILLTKDSEWTIGTGETCVLYFERYENLSFTASVHSMQGSGGERMVILEMNEDISALINQRKLTAVIGGRVEGMRVPNSSVVSSGDTQGVYIYETNEFVPVRVIGHDSTHTLVMPIEDGKLQKNMRVKK